MKVCIAVLGEIGRSPRMQYHAMSLAQCGCSVSLVGYSGARSLASLESMTNVSFHTFSPPLQKTPPVFRRFFYPLFVAVKALLLSVKLFHALFWRVERPDVILVQNPPAFPTLACAWLVCRLRGASLVVDWHNLGWSMLPYKPKHPIVRIVKVLEGFFGRRADASFCVSRAMADYLNAEFGVKAAVLYDRPPSHFSSSRLSTPAAQHALFSRLGLEKKLLTVASNVHAEEVGRVLREGNGASWNPFTSMVHGSDPPEYVLSPRRPALLVSSTSWTPDEDFNLLLEALPDFDKALSLVQSDHPGVVIMITGKGPLRGTFERSVASLALQYVSVATAWLEEGDYPAVLAAADLGLCFHTSTSGLDLPMKVVDMLGSGLPVVAARYNCIDELIQEKDGGNGRLFTDSQSLVQHLVDLLGEYRNGRSSALDNMVPCFATGCQSWDENWLSEAWERLQKLRCRDKEDQISSK